MNLKALSNQHQRNTKIFVINGSPEKAEEIEMVGDLLCSHQHIAGVEFDSEECSYTFIMPYHAVEGFKERYNQVKKSLGVR